MTRTLYDIPQSGHCHRVRLAASLMKIDLQIVAVMEMEGQLQGDAYLALNPMGQVPTLVEGDFVLRDSIAIIQYFERVYAQGLGWMPTTPQEIARVNEWLAIASGVMFEGPNMARLIKLFGMAGDYDAAVAMSEKLFKLMEKHLTGQNWLVGNKVSLADIACYSYVAVANEGELDLSPYPNINMWLASMQSLDGFVEIPKA